MPVPLAPVTPGELTPEILPPGPWPSVEDLITEDNTPMDNIYSEKQQRLLTRPLFSSWAGPGDQRPFVVMANVGMFVWPTIPPLVPDVLLKVGVKLPADLSQKKHRSYFFWEIGLPPDVTIEIVSNQQGGELDYKKAKYSQLGISYYVVWDPFCQLSPARLHVFCLHGRTYVPLENPWFPELELGVGIWHGQFEDATEDWLRWCDEQGQPIPTGEERAAREHQRAEQAETRAERLAAQLRQLRVEPENG